MMAAAMRNSAAITASDCLAGGFALRFTVCPSGHFGHYRGIDLRPLRCREKRRPPLWAKTGPMRLTLRMNMVARKKITTGRAQGLVKFLSRLT
jgi:hypothetical protein